MSKNIEQKSWGINSNKLNYEYEAKAEYLLVYAKGGKNLKERQEMLNHSIKLYYRIKRIPKGMLILC